MAEADQSNLTTLTVELLRSYVANNNIEHGDLGELIKSTHAALKVIDSPEPPAPVEPEYKPAVSVRKSLGSSTHIISLIDGKPYQTLKRHLAKHGLTPKDYRERYSLSADYPMVAQAYSESRRAIAERLGLGRKVTGGQTPAAPKNQKAAVPAAQVAKPVPTKSVKASPKASKSPAVTAKAEQTTPATTEKAVKAPRKAKAAATPAAAEQPAKPAPKARGTRKTSVPFEPVAVPKSAPRKRTPKAK